MRKTYTTTQGDMWDLIAKRLYNDEASLNACWKQISAMLIWWSSRQALSWMRRSIPLR